MKNYKKDFKMLDDGLTYLDTAATCLKPASVINAINEYYQDYSVNVNRGVYQKAFLATSKYEETRETVAKFINARPREVVYTRGASAAINLAALSYGDLVVTEGDEIIVSELEHHSNLLPWYNLAAKKNAVIKFVELDNNKITVENFKKVISNKTKIVALTHMSNVFGYETPIKEIIEIAHEFGAKVLVDAAQSIAHRKIDVKELDCDFLAFSAHKIFGPTGVGVLYGKNELLKLMPAVEFGGDMIDEVFKDKMITKDHPYKFETGTMPIASIIAFKDAIEYIDSVGYEYIEKYEKYLMDYLAKRLTEVEGVTVYNELTSSVLCFNVNDVHPHDIASVFDQNNVCLRAGHHCAQLITKKLAVDATLRASFYIYNDYQDIDNFIAALKESVDFFMKF